MKLNTYCLIRLIFALENHLIKTIEEVESASRWTVFLRVTSHWEVKLNILLLHPLLRGFRGQVWTGL